MAYENIQITYPNFCLGMQLGTFCTINTAGASHILRVKTDAGSIIKDYTLSSNLTGDLKALEYVGPLDHVGSLDTATFFTMEKISSSQCKIKRWELDENDSELQLKQTITKNTGGGYYYDALGMSVEHYRTGFSTSTTSGVLYIDVTSKKRMAIGDKLALGPSSDVTNLYAFEYATISGISGNRIYFDSPIQNEYITGDDICYYKYFYVVSALGYLGDTSRGSLIKLNANDGSYVEINTDGMYQSTNVSRWSGYVEAVTCVVGNNAVFVRPYDSYQVWKSMYLNNTRADKATVIPVEDIVFDEYVVHKLSNRTVRRDDNGVWANYPWGEYNYQADTLLPYTNAVNLYLYKSKLIGQAEDTTIYVKVVDQFGVGLLGKDVQLYKSGDNGAAFDPISGLVTTDANGEASIDYTSGNSYDGHSSITARTDGSSVVATGSQYVWNANNIITDLSKEMEMSLEQFINIFAMGTNIRQLSQWVDIDMSVWGRTFYTTPGGDWRNPSPYSGQVNTYLPTLIVGANDGPSASMAMGWAPGEDDPPSFENRITQVLDYEGFGYFRQLDDDFDSINNFVKQIGRYIETPTWSGAVLPDSELQISQLKLSYHTHWVSGTAYDYLWTEVSANQFIFVEDAIPKFWSEKNPIDTTIWIRLRPFAYDLNPATLKFFVKESWYAGDTGYVDFTEYCTITTFDAGGGIDGLDVLCTPPNDFHHNSVIYVHIEVYDSAPTPNFIYVDYWFVIIPDYRHPYLDNLNPARDQELVPVDTNVYFEIKDRGVGVDIDTLELYVNSRSVTPTNIERVNGKHYKITYDPTNDFYFNKEITVAVRVQDLSEFQNILVDSYRFYTTDSTDVWFTGFNPGICKRGFPRFADVEFLVLGYGSGVDIATLRVQVHKYDVSDKVTVLPVVYRIS